MALIPETLERTLWGQREAGTVINVEVDVDTQAIVTTLGRILKDPLRRSCWTGRRYDASLLRRLAAAHDHSDSLLCVGLDPDPKRFPSGFSRDGDGVKAFNRLIIDATAEHVCAFKPQIAYFAALGAEAALEDCIATIRDRAPHALVILDAKRGDIGDTAALYAREAFERYDADAVTVNPYLGTDSLEPFLAYEDRATIVLCRTSNVGGGEFQAEPSEAPLTFVWRAALPRIGLSGVT